MPFPPFKDTGQTHAREDLLNAIASLPLHLCCSPAARKFFDKSGSRSLRENSTGHRSGMLPSGEGCQKRYEPWLGPPELARCASYTFLESLLPRPGVAVLCAEPVRRPGEAPGGGVFEEREGVGGHNARKSSPVGPSNDRTGCMPSTLRATVPQEYSVDLWPHSCFVLSVAVF